MPTDVLFTEQEVADLLSVTTHAVRKWREKGHIAYIKIGRTIRFEPAEVQAFIARNRKKPQCECSR